MHSVSTYLYLNAFNINGIIRLERRLIQIKKLHLILIR